MIQKLMNEFAELIAPNLWVSVDEIVSDIVIAPDNVKGDLAFPCFKRAKTLWVRLWVKFSLQIFFLKLFQFDHM